MTTPSLASNVQPAQPLGDEELELLIAELCTKMIAAHKRFEQSYNRADRELAVRLKEQHRLAILSRSPAQAARIEAAIEQRIADGVDYFQDGALRHPVALRMFNHGR